MHGALTGVQVLVTRTPEHAIYHVKQRSGKYSPSAAVQGDMGWNPIIAGQWKAICNHWYRCHNYDTCRINKRMFDWALSKSSNRCKNWPFLVKDKLVSYNLASYFQLPFHCTNLVSYMTNALIDAHILQWRTDID
jgi:hypothetical protein